MLILPWNAAIDDAEWRDWLATTDRFGLLTVSHREAGGAPLAVPAHFTLDGEEIVLHLARPNPVWPHVASAREVRLAMVGDHAYVPSHWRASPEGPETDGVPTSYYTSVQFVGQPVVVDDPDEKAALLATQLADVQPEGRHGEVSAHRGPYERMLPGIRGLRLTTLRVEATFKYDDEKPVEHRERVNERLRERDTGRDRGAARQQRRRLGAVGEWRPRRGKAT